MGTLLFFMGALPGPINPFGDPTEPYEDPSRPYGNPSGLVWSVLKSFEQFGTIKPKQCPTGTRTRPATRYFL